MSLLAASEQETTYKDLQNGTKWKNESDTL